MTDEFACQGHRSRSFSWGSRSLGKVMSYCVAGSETPSRIASCSSFYVFCISYPVAYSGEGQLCDRPFFGLTMNFWIIFALFFVGLSFASRLYRKIRVSKLLPVKDCGYHFKDGDKINRLSGEGPAPSPHPTLSSTPTTTAPRPLSDNLSRCYCFQYCPFADMWVGVFVKMVTGELFEILS